MKRYGYLYEKVCDKENIREAIIKASKGKRKRRNVQKVLENIDESVEILYDLLSSKNFIPHPYKVKTIYDVNRQKEREICVPAFFPDQCVHWALMLVIEPIFKKRLYEYSCASVKGGGVHKAKKYIKRATQCDKKNTKWCLQMDIKKYYPSIRNDVLKTKMRRVFKDNDLLWLIDTIIDSHTGLPIGNYTSQWFANFNLCYLDEMIKSNSSYYVRYADDILIFASSKAKLHDLRKRITEQLESEGLSIKDNWQIYSINHRPISYLGFKFYRNKVVLRSRLFLKIRKKIRTVIKRGCISLRNARSLMSYYGWLIHTDSYYIYLAFKSLFEDSRRIISEGMKCIT